MITSQSRLDQVDTHMYSDEPIIHRSNGRVHQGAIPLRVCGKMMTVMITSQLDTRILSEVSRSIMMKSQRQTGRNLREIGRRMMESIRQKVAKVTLQSMSRRSRNGQKIITSQRTAKKTLSHKTRKIIIHQRTSQSMNQRKMITSLNTTKKMSQKKKAMIIMAPHGAFGIKSLVVMDVHLVIAR